MHSQVLSMSSKSGDKLTVESLLSDPLGGVTISLRSDNRKPKVTGLNGVGRVGLRSNN